MNEDLSSLTLVELLDLLEPVPEPPSVSLWPQTAGWLVLAVLLLAAAAWLVRRQRADHRANAYRRAALAELAAAGDDPARLAAILRRAALVAFPRADVAGLHGDDWLSFLESCCDGAPFRTGAARVVATAAYSPCAPDPSVTAQVAHWLRHHRRPPP